MFRENHDKALGEREVQELIQRGLRELRMMKVRFLLCHYCGECGGGREGERETWGERLGNGGRVRQGWSRDGG